MQNIRALLISVFYPIGIVVVQTRMNEVDVKFDRKFDDLQTCMFSLGKNSEARTQNSMVAFSDRRLSPLVNIRNGQPIPNFPATTGDLNRMEAGPASRVLLALGEATDGSVDVKRNRLRNAIGLEIGGVLRL
ncbi:hypothetical protein DSL72_006910 [Monilinia vaccinii-corymbosi]|uniref:Uncharacterized protein n=1 Tax=Monilinia vaccinii-corymbosi TaxID=61207 RepID=A0A8A3PKD1_9HELO|nr:hypothetical protein DSL72_006910 [Monilinia vaccinii-corymbosi]